MTLGQTIKAWREFRGMSQYDLGFKSHTDGKAVSHLEAGTRRPKIGTLEKIGRVLSVPVADLIDGKGPPRPEPILLPTVATDLVFGSLGWERHESLQRIAAKQKAGYRFQGRHPARNMAPSYTRVA